MAQRHMAWAAGASVGVMVTGWLASMLPAALGGAWAALTFFPGWWAYTTLSQQPYSESLDLMARGVITIGSWAFWTLMGLVVIRVALRVQEETQDTQVSA